MPTVNLVALQMTSGPDVDTNLEFVETQLASADLPANSVVVLPECFVCFGTRDGFLLTIAEQPGQGAIQERLSAMAARYRCYLVAGTMPAQSASPDKFTASCFVYGPNGDELDCYQKIHLFDAAIADNTKAYKESKYTQAGERVVVIDTDVGRIGVAVCYDVRFPGLFNAMGEIDILVLPAAFTQVTGAAHWHTLLRARAIEKQCYVVAAGQTGTHENGRETYGHSLIYSPWGDLLAERPSAPGLVHQTVSLADIKKYQQAMPLAQHNRFRSHIDKSS
ncbi:carbon-nitrogen hydrolase family protein [Alteromonas gilva]|uniref:Carbon-nitrogen hydrolase family protein n=1 Tax=Alteromonas gilva TaxID=2987522 RepID=A0ABT5KY96_9ALTE|nr:carbon-nitrogen hydrolase family protein [Alteromonas gilva]MDC8829745.1 carbon-nitrogen hydrolase family protein [Alteromonas gilva]